MESDIAVVHAREEPPDRWDAAVFLAGPTPRSPNCGPLRTALAEVAEETGLVLPPERLRAHGARQVNATLSAHRAHLFSAEVTAGELERLRASGPHGLEADGERTYVEITTYGRLRREPPVDWANLGMITEVLLDAS